MNTAQDVINELDGMLKTVRTLEAQIAGMKMEFEYRISNRETEPELPEWFMELQARCNYQIPVE